ncbi:MAG: ABC-F family ATP-binding cassette domain-containing protein [Bacteroidales bacterium]|jgi:ATP-binding cassette subfamily F protein 3|nr:ABC-F family ATP-binding cassette domain-containing protein [Bacteroidales bacterium]
MFSVQNITVQFSGTPLFRNVSFIINQKDRIGLAGKNGSGKTTLLKIIMGLHTPDEGEVVIPNDKTTGYLPQEIHLHNTKTVMEEAMAAFQEIRHLEQKIHETSHEITTRDDYESKSYHRLVDRLSELNEKHRILGGHTMDEDVEKVLTGLGFRREEFNRPLNQFSYGWQMRVEIAKLLLKRPDLVLLDEPTNHLDIEAIQWLEGFLSDYPGAVMLVSHDRAFLDNVTNRTIEIELGRIYDYKASYSEYVRQRESRLESQMAAFNNQQQQVRQIERFIERFRYKNTKSRQVQSRIKMLEKMEEIEIDQFDTSSIHFRFPPAPPSGKVVIEAVELSKSYGNKLVLEKNNFAAIKGDRIAFVGRNGEGKTTLARIIIGALEHEGNLRIGYNVLTGYYAQNPVEMLDPELTIFETIDRVAVGDVRTKIRTLLGGFLFGEEEIDKKVKVLSGGEKARLALAKLLLTPANLLVLDEPTNHLDMQSKDILKNALISYEGTLILVSHDRDFLQGLTNKVFEFKDRKIREYIGDIYDFLESRRIRSLKELEVNAAKTSTVAASSEITDNKQLYERKKQLERDIRRLSGQVEKCEETIHTLETAISKLNERLADPSKLKKGESIDQVYQEYTQTQKDLEAGLKSWEELNIELESLKELRGSIN